MSFTYKYIDNIYYTEPTKSMLSPGDIVLSEQVIESFFDKEDIKVETKRGTRTITIPCIKRQPVTVYYVISVANYKQMLIDFPLE